MQNALKIIGTSWLKKKNWDILVDRNFKFSIESVKILFN